MSFYGFSNAPYIQTLENYRRNISNAVSRFGDVAGKIASGIAKISQGKKDEEINSEVRNDTIQWLNQNVGQEGLQKIGYGSAEEAVPKLFGGETTKEYTALLIDFTNQIAPRLKEAGIDLSGLQKAQATTPVPGARGAFDQPISGAQRGAVRGAIGDIAQQGREQYVPARYAPGGGGFTEQDTTQPPVETREGFYRRLQGREEVQDIPLGIRREEAEFAARGFPTQAEVRKGAATQQQQESSELRQAKFEEQKRMNDARLADMEYKKERDKEKFVSDESVKIEMRRDSTRKRVAAYNVQIDEIKDEIRDVKKNSANSIEVGLMTIDERDKILKDLEAEKIKKEEEKALYLEELKNIPTTKFRPEVAEKGIKQSANISKGF